MKYPPILHQLQKSRVVLFPNASPTFSSFKNFLIPHRDQVSVHWELAVHDVSLLQQLMRAYTGQGRVLPKSVAMRGANSISANKEILDTAFLTLEYELDEEEQGRTLLAHIHVSWAEPARIRETVLVGCFGRIRIDDNDAQTPVTLTKQGIISPTGYVDKGEEKPDVSKNSHFPQEWGTAEPLTLECLEFAAAVRPTKSGGAVAVPPLRLTCPPQLAADVVLIVEKAEESWRTGGVPVVLI